MIIVKIYHQKNHKIFYVKGFKIMIMAILITVLLFSFGLLGIFLRK